MTDPTSAAARHRATDGRWHAWRHGIARSLLVAGEIRTTRLEGALVFVAAAVLEFFRLGSEAFAGRPWAEDAGVFIRQAREDGAVRAVSVRYAGYLHLAPRLTTIPVSALPFRWQGAAMQVAVAAVEAALALLVYVALSGHIRARWPRVALVVVVAAVPVGPEVVGSVANLQWFLLYAALVSIFWTPRTRYGWSALGVLFAVTVTSSPFGALVLVVVAARALLEPRRATLTLAVVTAAGFAVQTVGMLSAPPRSGSLARDPGLRTSQAAGFVQRVLGDGVLGSGRFDPGPHTSLVPGLAVLAGGAVLMLSTRREGHRRESGRPVPFATALVVLSVVAYLAPIVAGGSPTDDPYLGARYFVAPALLLATALLALCGQAVSRPTGRRAGALLAAPGRIVGVAMLAAIAFGVVTSYAQGAIYHRNVGPSWSSAVADMQRQCKGRPGSAPATTVVPPGLPNWRVTFRCRDVE